MTSITTIRRILGPFHAILFACATEAWRRWQRDFAPLLQLPYPRCRANVMYDLMVEEARKRLSDEPEIRFIEGRQRCLLGIAELLLRFKKVDDELHTSNYPTQTSIQYDQQAQLPGVPRGTRVTLGYRLDDLQQKLQAVFIILARGSRVIDFYELSEDGAVEVLPMAPVVPFVDPKTDTQKPKRIRGKRVDPAKEEQKESSDTEEEKKK